MCVRDYVVFNNVRDLVMVLICGKCGKEKWVMSNIMLIGEVWKVSSVYEWKMVKVGGGI